MWSPGRRPVTSASRRRARGIMSPLATSPSPGRSASPSCEKQRPGQALDSSMELLHWMREREAARQVKTVQERSAMGASPLASPSPRSLTLRSGRSASARRRVRGILDVCEEGRAEVELRSHAAPSGKVKGTPEADGSESNDDKAVEEALAAKAAGVIASAKAAGEEAAAIKEAAIAAAATKAEAATAASAAAEAAEANKAAGVSVQRAPVRAASARPNPPPVVVLAPTTRSEGAEVAEKSQDLLEAKAAEVVASAKQAAREAAKSRKAAAEDEGRGQRERMEAWAAAEAKRMQERERPTLVQQAEARFLRQAVDGEVSRSRTREQEREMQRALKHDEARYH